jgi:outer membrane scaffolding protein for murein synthesis (MipA/OmpV family)
LVKTSTFFIFIFFSISFNLYAGQLSTGIGHLIQEDFRVDNEVNPFPLGLEYVPIISYRTENLMIMGPRVRYSLLKGAIGAALHLEATGQRYESKEVELRESSIHSGASLRLFFLSLKHTSDISQTNHGNTSTVTLAHRFAFKDTLFIIPRISQRFTNGAFNTYYYGVKQSEVGTYGFYEVKNAKTDIFGVTVTARLGTHSLTINYSYRELDNVIFDSPTVKLQKFKNWAFFWSFPIF